MEKQKNIPRLRFREFSGEWEKKKLVEIGEIVTGSTPPTANHSYYNGNFLFVSPVDIQDNRYVTNTITTLTQEGFLKGRKISVGATMFVCIGSTIGKVAQAKQECITNQQINSILPFKNNNDFVFSLLEYHSGKIKLLSAVQAVPIINKTTFSNYYLSIPLLPEQQKIASFFTAIDQKSIQLKRKKTLLEQYKKGVMQKIFSQEIRFRNDNGQEFPKWEKAELGDLLLHKAIRNKESKVTLVLSVSNTRGFITQSEQFDNHRVASVDVSNYKIVNRNDFAYNPSRINVGSIARLTDYNEGIVSPMYVVFGLRESLNAIFFMNWIDTHRFKYLVRTSCSGSVRDSLNFEDLCNFPIKLPSYPEQIKIANFLSAIDDKITHTQKQIEKAEVWKKGLMQQMFC